MDELVGQWVGDLRGTDMGKVYAVFLREDDGIRATFTVNIDNVISNGAGKVAAGDGETIAELVLHDPAEAAPTDSATVTFDKITSIHVSGRWKTSTGHAGTLQLVRSDTKPISQQSSTEPQKPIEIVAREGKLSSLRVYRKELELIVNKIKALVGGTNDVVVAATIDDKKQIKQLSHDFFARNDLPQFITSINLSLNDGKQPIAKVIVVNLHDQGDSTFFVQSDDTLWVSGSFSELDGLFRRYTSPAFTFVHKYGLNANFLLLLAVVALLPEVPLLSRFVVLAALLLVVVLLMQVHKAVTSTRIYLAPELSRGFLSKVAPSLASALTAASLGAAVAWLLKAFPGIAQWLGFQ